MPLLKRLSWLKCQVDALTLPLTAELPTALAALSAKGDDGQPLLRIRLVAKTAGKAGLATLSQASKQCMLLVLLPYAEYRGVHYDIYIYSHYDMNSSLTSCLFILWRAGMIQCPGPRDLGAMFMGWRRHGANSGGLDDPPGDDRVHRKWGAIELPEVPDIC